MLKKRRILIFFTLTLFMIPISYSIGIGLYTTEVNFEPNLNENYKGLVTNNVGEDIIVEMKTKGELTEYVTFGQEFMEIPAGQVASFTFNIKLPENIKPGLNILQIGSEDITPSKGGGISSRTAAFFPFKVRMPYPGKYIEASFSAASIEEGQTAEFNIALISRGNETIKKISGVIEIFDGEDKVDVLSIGPISDIAPGESREIKTEWDSTGQPVGEYSAKAKIDYDENIIELNAVFKIGTLLVDIINYTKEVYKDEINKFDIEIESYWNNQINDVYGEIKVGGQKIETLKINLGGWGRAKIAAYLDTANLNLGEHTAYIKVYYGDKVSEETGKITVLPGREKVIEKPSKVPSTAILLVIVIVLLVIGNAILVIYFVRQRKISKGGKKRKKK